MQVYIYSEARQKLALLLEQVENTGKVLIRRKDGRIFALVPEQNISSPLDVPPIKAKRTTQEIVDIIREGRERQKVESGSRGFFSHSPTIRSKRVRTARFTEPTGPWLGNGPPTVL